MRPSEHAIGQHELTGGTSLTFRSQFSEYSTNAYETSWTLAAPREYVANGTATVPKRYILRSISINIALTCLKDGLLK